MEPAIKVLIFCFIYVLVCLLFCLFFKGCGYYEEQELEDHELVRLHHQSLKDDEDKFHTEGSTYL